MKRTIIVLSVLLLPTMVGAQTTGCWDFADYSDVTLNYPGPGNVSVMVLPDGGGDPLTTGRRGDGGVFDASIDLVLRDCNNVPIPGFPCEDLWLESAGGIQAMCPGGSIADHNTDANGRTAWTLPLRAGGQSEIGCLVMLSGSPLIYTPLNLVWNSPDLNGDLAVNLTDVVMFVEDYWDAYAYRSDFNRDGALNLSDVGRMAMGIGSTCP